ncbi:DUF6510 family protein [Micromonospora avicenniae]|uniref:MJ0042 family finger-like domain-containing protein n=1 Tax=Micromonospora avicenniae TaxID=1198245 RepID=A0A1N7DZR8_9ACTN|nr:DUF6510 family protein [Micromonospora avicenniae]SIR81319.1 hypothetical protein SAMN05444858_11991 [Micromonospora avicenniae]
MTDMSYLDGNMMDGPLRELFAVDLSGATGRCENCGMVGPMGTMRVYSHAPGLIGRCPSCAQVMLRFVRSPNWARLDLRGLTFLQVPMPLDQPHPGPM